VSVVVLWLLLFDFVVFGVVYVFALYVGCFLPFLLLRLVAR
jgi:hypothetical protein